MPGGECGIPFLHRYYTPANKRLLASVNKTTGPTSAQYYSFDRGPVHFLLLDTEMPSNPGSEQARLVPACVCLFEN